jgi:hypothetical protein
MAEKMENANERRGKEATFPAQALSCSGSTGIISASYSRRGGKDSAPRELYRAGFPPAIQIYVTVWFIQRQIIEFICNNWS